MGESSRFVLRCGLEVRGRVALAPMTNLQSRPDGTLGEDELTWLRRRAEGGFAWVSTCAAYVSPDGKAWPGQLGVSEDAHLPGLERLASAVREAGATAIIQLHHGGPMASLAPDRPLGTVDRPGGTRGATEAELAQVVEDFVQAALRAERAGFEGVEIHGANGYLFTHFLSPVENPREDGYGGDLAGRARLLREATQAIRAAVGTGFAVGARINPVDFFADRGLTLVDGVQVARWLAEDGADFVHLSQRDAGGADPADPDGPPIARVFRDALPEGVAVLAAGGIWTAADLRRALAAGVDIAAVGKAGIIHPDWPRACQQDGWSPTRPPLAPEALREAAVGEDFVNYLKKFPGLVQGGAEPR